MPNYNFGEEEESSKMKEKNMLLTCNIELLDFLFLFVS